MPRPQASAGYAFRRAMFRNSAAASRPLLADERKPDFWSLASPIMSMSCLVRACACFYDYRAYRYYLCYYYFYLQEGQASSQSADKMIYYDIAVF